MSNYRYDYVQSQVDTQEYISRYTNLKRVGLVYRCTCPFPHHNEKTPSFTVYPAGFNDPKLGPQRYASFFCFGCKTGGDIFTFKKAIEGLDTRFEALQTLEKELGIDMNDEEIQQNYLKEQLGRIKNIKSQTLSSPEINMACSSMCRNYLNWVKENYKDKYEDEVKLIDKYYLYFDVAFDEKSASECMQIIDDVQEKLNKRRMLLIG